MVIFLPGRQESESTIAKYCSDCNLHHAFHLDISIDRVCSQFASFVKSLCDYWLDISDHVEKVQAKRSHSDAGESPAFEHALNVCCISRQSL